MEEYRHASKCIRKGTAHIAHHEVEWPNNIHEGKCQKSKKTELIG